MPNTAPIVKHSEQTPPVDFGFRSVFARLFTSVFLAIAAFAMAMFVWIQLVNSNSDVLKNRGVARQIASQIEPFLAKAESAAEKGNRFQARMNLVVIKKSFDIFDESLNAKIGLYDSDNQLILQTDDSHLPSVLLDKGGWLSDAMPTFWGNPPSHAQVSTDSGFTIWYESRTPPATPPFAGVFNVFTGTLLLFAIMTLALWLIAKNMTHRLNEMSRQMSLMAEGDFSVRVTPKGNDEIAFLAHGFNQAAHKIEQLINANNLLLAHASHEFRTPITRMRLQTEMLAMLGDNLPSAQGAQLDKRLTAINRDLTGLNDLIESILLVSRLDAGHALEQMQPIDFYETILQECQHFSEASLFGEHVTLLAQPKLITHLIRNLLNNAMLHGVPPISVYVYGCQTSSETPIIPSEFVQISAQTTDNACVIDPPSDLFADEPSDSSNTPAQVSDNSKPPKSLFSRFKKSSTPKDPAFAVLAVVDNGEGIAVDKRESIFSPFVRLKQEKKGSGLGLSLVAQIVHAHGGTITTDTWQGNTRFLVVLPIKCKQAPKTAI